MPLDPPRHEQIFSDLQGRIRNGEFEDHKLPSEMSLARHYDASRNTIRRALQRLVNQGTIRSVPGRGYELPQRTPLIYYASLSEQEKRRGTAESDIWRTDVLEQGRRPGQQLTVTREPAPDEIAALLRLEDGAEEVAIRHRVRLVDGEPWATSVAYWPAYLFGETPIMQPHDLQPGPNRIAHDLGYPQPRLHDQITARMPDLDETRVLRIDPGIPVHVHIRTGYVSHDEDATAVRVTVNVLPADRWIIDYTVSTDG